jgi:hypothetical protein
MCIQTLRGWFFLYDMSGCRFICSCRGPELFLIIPPGMLFDLHSFAAERVTANVTADKITDFRLERR